MESKIVYVKDILTEYHRGGLQAVSTLVHQFNIDPSSWAGQIKKDIDEKRLATAITKIELLDYKFIKKGEKKDGEPGK